MKWIFSGWLALGLFVTCMLSGCAMADTPMHSFSFDAKESPEAQILDYEYGDSKLHGTRPEPYLLQEGRPPQMANTYGAMQRGEFLWVKWQIKRTGQIYEDRVDLRNHLPADLTGYRIHFVVNGPQLYVYLISPEKISGHCPANFQNEQEAIKKLDPHDTVLFTYCYKKISLIYPEQHDPNSTPGAMQ